jgi:Flp pilus assembly protein TadD
MADAAPMDAFTQWFAEALGLHQQGNLSGASLAWRRLLSRHPENQDAWINYGSVLRQLGRQEEALEALRRAEEAGDERVSLLLLRAGLLHDQGRIEEALQQQLHAVALAPDNLEARVGLGQLHHRLGQSREALAADDAALALSPDHPGVLVNRSASLLRLQRTQEAIADCRRSLALDPDNPLGHLNLGIALLLDGQLEEGFKEYEWRWRVSEVSSFDPGYAEPRWDGAPFPGKTLLLWCEQGLGDTLMALRAVPVVKAMGGRVILAVQSSLVGMAMSAGADEVVSEESPKPSFDLHAPLMSLFHLLGPDPTGMAPVPYLCAPESDPPQALVERFKGLVGRKVGLVWSGNPVHRDNAYRRLDPQLLAPFGTLSGITWVSLQRWEGGPPTERPPFEMVDVGDLLHRFEDTAYALSQLDLLVSIDTSVLHLAGALGRPTLALLAYAADWRWQLHRSDSPWYPTVRLIRQPAAGDWRGLVEEAMKAMR